MKKMIFLILASFFIIRSHSQSVAINITGATADASAILDITSTTKGMLIPRLTTAQRTAISTPATGLIVYDTDLNQFYFWNGTSWTNVNTNYWTLSGSNLYNNAGTTVGIGLTGPVATLDIAGTSGGTNSLLIRSGNTNASSISTQIALGFNNTANYRHAIKSRHNSGAQAGNAIDFYVWQQGVDAIGTIGTKQVMTLDGNGFVGINTTVPMSTLQVNNGNLLVNGTFGSGPSIEPTGGGSRMFFNPRKGALMAGVVNGTQWDDANVGSYAIALGSNPQAKTSYSVSIGEGNISETSAFAIAIGRENHSTGFASLAMGHFSEASGDYSAAIGLRDTVSGYSSTALGGYNKVTNYSSFAAGGGNIVSGFNGVALGNADTTSGNNSFTAGGANKVSGDFSGAIGANNKLSNDYSFATGQNNNITNAFSFAAGTTNTLTNAYTFAAGQLNNVSGNSSFAAGVSNTVSGGSSAALGQSNTVTSFGSMALGYQLTVGGYGTFAAGRSNSTTGNHSAVFGFGNAASSDQAFVIGLFNTGLSNNTFTAGIGNTSYSWGETTVGSYATSYSPSGSAQTTFFPYDRAFAVGNGTGSSTRSNAIEVWKNGFVGINNVYPTSTLTINGSVAYTAITKTSNSLLLDQTNHVVIYTGGAGNTFTFSPAPSTGRVYRIINYGTAALTLPTYTNGNASTSTTLAVGDVVELIYDGANWIKIN